MIKPQKKAELHKDTNNYRTKGEITAKASLLKANIRNPINATPGKYPLNNNVKGESPATLFTSLKAKAPPPSIGPAAK